MNQGAAFVSPAVSITPEMEAFFVAILLDHGTRPAPELYGFERHKLSTEIAKLMDQHPAMPEVMLKVKNAGRELGAHARGTRLQVSHLDDDWVYFTLKIADAYLDWLYAAARLRAARTSGL